VRGERDASLGSCTNQYVPTTRFSAPRVECPVRAAPISTISWSRKSTQRSSGREGRVTPLI
jgi:hypothetical protein